MAIFYPPPQQPVPLPVQNGPFVPIPQQGDQPPKGPTASLVNSIIVRMAWEPPPPMPTQLELELSPLTLAYGDQPPLGPTAALVNSITVRSTWEPPPPMPWQLPSRVLGIWSVDLPPPSSIVNMTVVRLAWEPPPPMPQQLPLTFAPLTLAYGDQPPRGPTAALVNSITVRLLSEPPWTPPQSASKVTAVIPLITQPPATTDDYLFVIRQMWEPPPPMPEQRALKIAPLTLTYGQQPPPGPTAALVNSLLVRQMWEPGPPMPQQSLGYIQSLVLVYGSQPPPLSYVNQETILQSWVPPWTPAQQAGPGAAVQYVTPVVNIPPLASAVNLALIRQMWEPPPPQPQQGPQNFAVLSLPTGSQPPLGPTAALVNAIIVKGSWEPPPPQPQRDPKKIAPLTLTYGSQPPKLSYVTLTGILRSWEPPWTPAQVRPPGAAEAFVVPTGNNPPFDMRFRVLRLIVAAWQPPDPLPQQSFKAAPGISLPPGPPVVHPEFPSHAKPLLARQPQLDPRARRFTELLTNFWNSAVTQGYIVQQGAADYQIIGGGFQAARNPTATDDVSIGVNPGNTWVNVLTNTAFINVSNNASGAIWTQAGGTGGGGVTVAQWSTTPYVIATAPPFNADPTGNTDSTLAFNRAQAFLGTTGGTVFIPPGNYLVSQVGSSQIAITMIRGVSWIGAGAGSTILKQTGSNYTFFYDGSVGNTSLFGRISDMTIDGNNVGLRGVVIFGSDNTFVVERCNFQNWNSVFGGFNEPALDIEACSGVEVRNCFFTNNISPIKLFSPAENITIHQCRFTNNNGALCSIIDIYYCYNITIKECNFYLNGTVGTPILAMIAWNNTQYNAGLTMRDCLFHSNYATYGVRFTAPGFGNIGTSLHVLEHNHMISNGFTYGVYVDGTTGSGPGPFGPIDTKVTMIANWFDNANLGYTTADVYATGVHAFVFLGGNYIVTGPTAVGGATITTVW